MHEKYETTYFADDRTVTIDEAVAKLIGWMRTERRIPHLQVTLDGIDRTQFVRLYRLPEPLMKIIHDERETARLKLFEAADAWFASTKSSEFSDKKRNELFEIVAAREARDRLLRERVELISRRVLRDLQRRAQIDIRQAPAVVEPAPPRQPAQPQRRGG